MTNKVIGQAGKPKTVNLSIGSPKTNVKISTTGTGSVGTRDYLKLTNRPSINGVELIGDQSAIDLRIVSENTTDGWAANPTYIPRKGEIVIYTDGTEVTDGETVLTYPELKIGDGNAYVADLPFIGEVSRGVVLQKLEDHMADDISHVSQSDRDFWNAKLNYELNGDELVLTRN